MYIQRIYCSFVVYLYLYLLDLSERIAIECDLEQANRGAFLLADLSSVIEIRI